MLTTGEIDAGLALVHLLYLTVMAVLGTWLAVRALERRLLT